MRLVQIDSVKEGMILAKPLLGKNDKLLLNKGVILLPSYINGIRQHGYSGVYIEDDLSKDLEIPSVIDDHLRFETIKSVKSVFSMIEEGKNIPLHIYRNLESEVNNIVESILENTSAIISINDLKTFDNYTFCHSVNVCILSIIIGKEAGFGKNQLYDLGIAAILHDIGKTLIPKEILNKSEPLTAEEFDLIKTHSKKGYDYVKNNFDIPAISCIGILHHHEKYDGLGYPMGVKGSAINRYARIVSVSDVFDAVTSDRPYRKGLPPFEAIEYIMGNNGIAFDPNIVKIFTQKIAPYPVGTTVRLSDGRRGLIMENYPGYCTRPKIKIYMHGDMEITPYILDMKNDVSSLGVVVTGVA